MGRPGDQPGARPPLAPSQQSGTPSYTPTGARRRAATQKSQAAAPTLTFDLTFIFGDDLFVLLESARGGHRPAVRGSLPTGEFRRVVAGRAARRGREPSSLCPKPEAAPREGPEGRRGERRRRDGRAWRAPGAPPCSGLSRRGRWRAEPRPETATRPRERTAGASTAAGRTRWSRRRRAPSPGPARGSPRRLPSCCARLGCRRPAGGGMAVSTRVRSSGREGRRRRHSDASGSAQAEFASREPAPRGSPPPGSPGARAFSPAHWPRLPPAGRTSHARGAAPPPCPARLQLLPLRRDACGKLLPLAAGI